MPLGGPWPAATVPSVTNYSRATLLSAALTRGDSGIEKRNFEANSSLRDRCDKRQMLGFPKGIPQNPARLPAHKPLI
jgi:hypothetical protein